MLTEAIRVGDFVLTRSTHPSTATIYESSTSVISPPSLVASRHEPPSQRHAILDRIGSGQRVSCALSCLGGSDEVNFIAPRDRGLETSFPVFENRFPSMGILLPKCNKCHVHPLDVSATVAVSQSRVPLRWSQHCQQRRTSKLRINR